jgi:deazaflavin-dependent oxidoreductase (nitroreductase family)
MFRMSKRNQTPCFYSIVNPIFHFLVLRFGLGTQGEQDVLRILRVRGRKSGRIYEMPVRIAIMDRQRYIISMLGETQWVHNLRATGSAQLLAGRDIESVRAGEIVGEEKSAFLAWYCQHPEFAQRARYALKANTEQITPMEIERLSQLWPIFRLKKE